MKADSGFSPHLLIEEVVTQAGDEWEPRMPGWSLIQVRSGEGYWLHPRANQKLEAGAMLLLADPAQGCLRASLLGEVFLHYFRVEPERLTGLISLTEQRFFEAAASAQELAMQVLPRDSSPSVRFKDLCLNRNGQGFAFRLQLLQLFAEVVGGGMHAGPVEPGAQPDAKERVWGLLKQTPASGLLDLSFSDLAQRASCTPRHLSRIFHELVGMTFREKQAEIRLARASELLATTESKVVDVALECGYQSLSLFNLMFKKRFGTSPGKWRRKQHGPSAKRPWKSRAVISGVIQAARGTFIAAAERTSERRSAVRAGA